MKSLRTRAGLLAAVVIVWLAAQSLLFAPVVSAHAFLQSSDPAANAAWPPRRRR